MKILLLISLFLISQNTKSNDFNTIEIPKTIWSSLTTTGKEDFIFDQIKSINSEIPVDEFYSTNPKSVLIHYTNKEVPIINKSKEINFILI